MVTVELYSRNLFLIHPNLPISYCPQRYDLPHQPPPEELFLKNSSLPIYFTLFPDTLKDPLVVRVPTVQGLDVPPVTPTSGLRTPPTSP